MTAAIDLGLIGRHFFDDGLDIEQQVSPTTRWGSPSSPITIANIEGVRVGILHRHGNRNEFLPHQVPYAANVAALANLGATDVLAFTVVGSLSREVRRGDFLLCDQYIDFTWGRQRTIFDGNGGAHANMAEPFCERLRGRALSALRSETSETVHPRATSAVINGPKFQTKAESRYYAKVGADVINMTQSTEAALAREMELCYVNVSLCTDYGVLGDAIGAADNEGPVASDDVVGYLAANTARVTNIVRYVIPSLTSDPTCACRVALEGMRTFVSEE